MAREKLKRVGNHLVYDSSRIFNFYANVEADPFRAGASLGSSQPMRVFRLMDFNPLTTLMALSDIERFQRAIGKKDQWQRFHHGWCAAFSQSILFATDDTADKERSHAIKGMLDEYSVESSPALDEYSDNVSNYIKEHEFNELQGGMLTFSVGKSWEEASDREHAGYLNFDSELSWIKSQLVGADPMKRYTIDNALEGAAVSIADIMARRTNAAYITGYLAMAGEYDKTSMFAM